MNVSLTSIRTHRQRYVLLFSLFTVLISNQTLASGSDAHTMFAEAIVNETNLVRSEHGLEVLIQDPRLVAAAQEKANKMAQLSEFSHTLSDGTTGWSLFGKYNYCFSYGAENLALFFTDAESLVAAWMNSPSHRKNILSAKAKNVGIGIAAMQWEGYEGLLVVQALAAEAYPTDDGVSSCSNYSSLF